ncbi:MAG TPA: serine hydrolase domain-containing protein, partial [Ilumatobacteraceae bacterium]|nr:serine hydrolase domain-containing protein [Ilumatobacteraceae bacterium]
MTIAVPSTVPSNPAGAEPSAPPSTIEPWSGADFGGLDSFLAGTGTEAFRIVEAGAVVHEWYRTDAGYARDIASAQKSVLSLLVGRAVADGLFALDTTIDSVLGTTWAPGSVTDAVTVRHLLSMTSGLDDTFAVIAAPGESWNYSGAFAALFDVVTTTTGRTLGDVAGDWLFDPAGAATARFYERRSGAYAPIGLRATATDLTAIGQTVLDGTQPGLGTDWLADSFASSQPFNPAYGLLWWINGGASYVLPGRSLSRLGSLIPSAPADLVAALGKDDQKL